MSLKYKTLLHVKLLANIHTFKSFFDTKRSHTTVRFRISLRKEVAWVHAGKSINDAFTVVSTRILK